MIDDVEVAKSDEDSFVSQAELQKLLEEERRERERTLLAQEHRLLPAFSALLQTLVQYRGPDRNGRVVATATALFWCLIPSPGTATIGIIAIASLFMSWQQTRLLALQNERVEIQNMLSEAQRRSSLMFETTELFKVIDEDKRDAMFAKTMPILCNSAVQFQCWRKGGLDLVFVPQQSTIGRLVSLSQALRPYRYLKVENDEDGCSKAEKVSLLEPIAKRAGSGDILSAASIKKALSPNFPAVERSTILQKIWGWAVDIWEAVEAAIINIFRSISTAVDLSSHRYADVALSCKSTSPERGQLLVSLHSANLDISRLASSGADFRYADIVGAQLDGIELVNVDLSFSRLPKAKFKNARLEDVSFEGADLTGVSFAGAVLTNVRFRGTIIGNSRESQVQLGDTIASMESAKGLKWHGLRLQFDSPRIADFDETKESWTQLVCRAIGNRDQKDLARYDVLLESENGLHAFDGMTHEAIILERHRNDIAKSAGVLLKRKVNKRAVVVGHFSLSDC